MRPFLLGFMTWLWLILMLGLTGCEEPKELGTFVEVEVTNVEEIEHCSRGCWYDYEVTVEKNGTSVTLNVDEKEMANLLRKGNVVTITYNDEYSITSVIFPTMEKGDSK